MRAFQVNAVDYVLKQFAPDRLELAVERARQRLLSPTRSEDRQRLLEMIELLRGQSRRNQRLVIRTGETTYLQRVEEIDWIEAEAKYVRIHVGTRAHLMRESMTRLEQRLDPANFVRVSRSAIVNLDRVAEIKPWFKGELLLLMQSGARITTTRSYRDSLTKLLAQED